MPKRRTHEEFIEEVKDFVGDEYTVLSPFIRMKDSITMRHNACGLEYNVTPDKFLGRGDRCPTCSRKKTHIGFLRNLQNLVGDEYTPLETYRDSKTKISMLHNRCGNVWKVTPNQFISGGTRCPTCYYGSKKRSHSEFMALVRELEGGDYSVISEYKSSREYVRIRHNVCGYEYEIVAHSFLQGRRCKKCANLKRIKTHEEFLEEVHSIFAGEITVLETYKGNHEKIRVRHNSCGYEYPVRAYSLTSQKTGCPKCARNLKRTTADFVEIVHELVGNEYEVAGEYVNALKHIDLFHHVCGTIYRVTPAGFLSGKRCSFCYGNKKKNTDIFKKEVLAQVGDEYEVLSEYITNNHPVTMLHRVCNYEYLVKPAGFLNGSRCSNCYGNIQKTTDEFKREVFDISGSEYTVLGEYINRHTLILMKHRECGSEYEVTPNAFIRGNRCPVCKESKGERRIAAFLDLLGYSYQRQYKILECKHKRPLPFDFVVFDGEMLLCMIEFDGEQHFHPLPHFGGEKGFKMTKKRDTIKDEFCKKNNIPLLRIPYTKIDEVEEILSRELPLLHENTGYIL